MGKIPLQNTANVRYIGILTNVYLFFASHILTVSSENLKLTIWIESPNFLDKIRNLASYWWIAESV